MAGNSKGNTSPGAPNPVEMALEAVDEGRDRSGVAVRLLTSQVKLIEEQIGLARNERFRNRIKAWRDGGVAALVLAAGIVVGAVVWDAAHADGMVIQPFVTTPALAAEGLDGPTVSNRLLDRLAALQAQTISARQGRAARGSTEDIIVEIPQTGVSLGEVQRMLRGWLGRETVVGGVISRGADGALRITVRAGERQTVVEAAPGAGADEAVLIDRAAEAIFALVEPYRYAIWLRSAGREEESYQAMRRLGRQGRPEDRAWGLSGAAVSLRERGDLYAAADMAAEAARLGPRLVTPFGNLANISDELSHDEAAFQAVRRLNANSSHGATTDDRLTIAGARARLALMTADYADVMRRSETMTRNADSDNEADSGLLARAAAQAGRHQASASRRTLGALLQPYDPLSGKTALDIFLAQQATLGDWAAMERTMRAPWRTPPRQAGLIPSRDQCWRAPWLAMALARLGRMDEARAVIGATPLDCDRCLVTRGHIAALGGNRAEADRWFTRLVGRTPSLAQPRLEWGRALLEAGHPDDAARQFSRAARLAPRWADPLGYWGEASLAAGDPRAAIRRFRAADRLAPEWGRNHWLWGEALLRLDKPAEARLRFERARRLDLSAAERASVERRLSRS